MRLKHVALTCSSEQNADRFYRDLLGLEKTAPKRLPSDLAKAIFGLKTELTIINYLDEQIQLEIFIAGRHTGPAAAIDHLCVEVNDLHGLIEKCRALEVKIKQIPRGEYTLTFIKDFDGHLFEIKEKPNPS